MRRRIDFFVQATYRHAFGPFARRALRRALERGLPPTFRPAIEFLINNSLDPAARVTAARVELLRDAVARRTETFRVTFASTDPRRTGEQIAAYFSVNRKWGLVLHLCAREFDANTILELGSCAGISGSYLASAPTCRHFVTVEATPELAALAAHNLGQVFPPAEVQNGFIEEVLPAVLSKFKQGIDLVYIDARHERDATLSSWRQLRPRLNNGSLVVFDDIRLSPGMWEAWNIVRKETGLSCTVDLGRFGFCLHDSRATHAAHHDFAIYTGWWRILRRK